MAYLSIEPIEALSTWLCTFYTVRLQGQDKTEFEQWYERAMTEDPEGFEVILAVLKLISERGAAKRRFRPELGASALPSPSKVLGFDAPPLRLYCYRDS